MQETEELQLAQNLLAGKQGAFDQFVSFFHPRLFHYAYLMCGQREDAEEVSQDTLLAVFESIGKLKEASRLKAWVFRIAKNACLMKRRKSVFAPNKVLSLDGLMPTKLNGGQGIQIADWSELPEDGVLRGELRGVLDHVIAELPEMYRSVLLLRDVEGLNTADTADILGENEAVIKQRLHRARLAVRAKLDEYLRTREAGEHNGKG
ncbi:MAG TPA: RNA polymerase sigma factor [Bryobacteraceae bacterium]|nr:RNA polymerase sigma factor [Bryobacteraceae bacterium]